MRKKSISILICIILIIPLVLISIYKIDTSTKNNFHVGNVALNKKISKSKVKKDCSLLIDTLEKTHPIFLDGFTTDYLAAKNKFIEECDRRMTIGEFQLYISEYMSSLRDAHTGVIWSESSYLDINWKYKNCKLVLLDNEGIATNDVVTHINNIKIEDIIKIVDKVSPAENIIARDINIEVMSKEELVLTYSGVDCSKDVYLTIKTRDNIKKVKVDFKYPKNNQENKSNIYSKKLNDTIYVKLGICEINDDLNNVISMLKKSLNYINNVIIDIRDNPGGNSDACKMLLEAMNIKPGEFGGVKRYSPLAKSIYPDYKNEGYEILSRNNNVIKNEAINLYVIVNEYTFSSAQWMATWVKDGSLGLLIGTPLVNNPNSYGDILPFELPNSKLKISIPHVKWLRPDSTKDKENVLTPDVYIKEGEDPLEVTLKIINEK